MRTITALLALLVSVIAGETYAQTAPAAPPVAVSSTPGQALELWEMKFPSLEACVQARTQASPAWPQFLAEAICKETQYGNAVPPGYYEQGACEIRQKDRKMKGVIKRSGYNAFPLYCSNTYAEKRAHANIKLE